QFEVVKREANFASQSHGVARWDEVHFIWRKTEATLERFASFGTAKHEGAMVAAGHASSQSGAHARPLLSSVNIRKAPSDESITRSSSTRFKPTRTTCRHP